MDRLIKKMNEDKTEDADAIWRESWTYIKTVVDTVREPFLILDEKLCVLAANESFYRIFQVEQNDTEGNHVYELGNGQWNIPSLKKLLEDILPKNSFFKGFEVDHKFPHIGRKIMILNARRVYRSGKGAFPPIILLAMEDVTDMMDVAEMLAQKTNEFQADVTGRTTKLEEQIKLLQALVDKLNIEQV